MNRNSLWLTIVLPVYNVEKYLSKCLDSLLDQDLPQDEYEIIAVNDGSTDDSLRILTEYSFQNKNIKLINQSNRGLSVARNAGISEASGKYLMFIDSDDYIQSNVLKGLVEFMEFRKLDMLRYNYESVTESGEIIPKTRNSLKTVKYLEEVVKGDYFLSHQLGWACYACMFVYRLSFIKENNFSFKENILFEDIEWTVNLLLSADRVCSYKKIIYFYLQRSGSITKSMEMKKKEKIYNDKLHIILYLHGIIKEKKDKKNIAGWLGGMITLMIISLFPIVLYSPEKKENLLHFLKHHEMIPLKTYKFTTKQKFHTVLINISPAFYLFFLKNRKKQSGK
jgi:glycosyltransferase involved in cell wall biosynthesis